MELEFDKEMDSLLRKADRGVLVGDTEPDEKPKVHLDADQLSAFAENAIPERSRVLYMSHLADCDRCRRILSGLIALNAEAMPAEERVVAPAISPAAIEPWYRRLLIPNLAYVMGGLVLVFGGLIAISVLQSSESGEVSMSQTAANIADPAARGPMFEDAQAETEQMVNSNQAMSSNAAASASNTVAVANRPMASANSMANAASGAPLEPPADMRKESDRDSERERKILLDGADAAKPAMAAPAAPVTTAPQPKVAEKTEIADATVAVGESKDDAKAKSMSAKKVEDLPLSQRQTQELARTQAGGVAKSTPGPSRDAQQNFPNRANNTFDLYEEKRISGKSFQRRNSVWYDISYRSGATINVRRGSDEYRKLDSGLRSIAESLSGVVVVMWSGKAYRIQ